MEKILIERYDDDPEALGCIRPESDAWQLIIDKEGFPHLYIATKVEVEGQRADGMFCLDDLLPDEMQVKDIAEGTFGGELPPEELAEAVKECEEKGRRAPCPAKPLRPKYPPPRA